MCELFALSSRHPAAVTFSLETLSRHGRADNPIGDGWGVGFYDGADVRVLREPSAIYESPWVEFIEQHGPKSNLVISHIRRVSTGSKRLAEIGRRSVNVDVTSVVRASDDSFEIRWTEKTYASGQFEKLERFTAHLTIVVSAPRNEQALHKNPLGLYVHGINWSKDLSSGERS